jgi:hypothetical protein
VIKEIMNAFRQFNPISHVINKNTLKLYWTYVIEPEIRKTWRIKFKNQNGKNS